MSTNLARCSLGWAALGAVGIWFAVDGLRWLPEDPIYANKLRAAQVMQEGIAVLRAERERRGLGWEEALDPNHTGLIGRSYTDLTTTLGSLPAKRTTTNPNMAGLVVELLARAGAGRGDPIAVAFSGSFPAWNLAVLAAARAMELRPVVISSVGASSFGANEPGWTWPDMERVLAERGVIGHRSAWIALGGIIDEQGGLDGTGLEAGGDAIRRSGVPRLEEGGRATLAADVQRRMRLFRDGCGGRPRVFVNVGGGLTSLGGGDRRLFCAGLVPPGTRSVDPARGLIVRWAEEGVPVVHLLDVRQLAEKSGLPWDPVPLPAVPAGAVMRPRRFGREIAAGGLVALGLIVFALERRRRLACAGPPPATPPRSDRTIA